MFIMSAKKMDRILTNLESGAADARQVDFQFQMHRDAMEFHIENLKLQPSTENYKEAAEHIKDSLGVIVEPNKVEEILSLFPSARIKLAKYDGCSDTEVRDLISEAFGAFFSGSDIATFGDEIDTTRFYNHLKNQAKLMGFSTVED